MARIVEITPNVFTFEQTVKLDPLGWTCLPARSVVIRTDEGLVVHAPLALDDELRAEIDGLGEVRHLVAPNLFHHLHFGAWADAYPLATTWGVSSFANKRRDLSFAGTLADGAAPAGLEAVAVGGMPKLEEVVLFHPGSRTLVMTDLVFNVRERPPGWMTGAVLRLAGTKGRCAQSKLVRGMTKDPEAAARSYERILELDFHRATVSHGKVIETDAKAMLKAALVGPT